MLSISSFAGKYGNFKHIQNETKTLQIEIEFSKHSGQQRFRTARRPGSCRLTY